MVMSRCDILEVDYIEQSRTGVYVIIDVRFGNHLFLFAISQVTMTRDFICSLLKVNLRV